MLREPQNLHLEQERFQLQSTQPGYFKQLVDAIPQIVWIMDKAGSAPYFNRRWFDFTGYNPTHWNASEDCMEAVHADDRSRVQNLMLLALQGEKTFDAEYRLRRRDGVYRWHLGRLDPIHDTSGNVQQYFGTATDIEDQVVARRRVEESEVHLRLALTAARMGTYDWLISENTIIFSAQTELVFGLDPGEFRGTLEHLQELLHPRNFEFVLNFIQKEIETSEEYCYEFRVIWPKSKSLHWLSVYGKADTVSGKVTRLIGTVVDITEQKEAWRALKASERKARTLNDLAPVGISETDEFGNCTFVNQCWSKLSGLSLEESLGQGWVNAIHPHDREHLVQEWSEAFSQRKEFYREIRFRGSQDQVNWVFASAVPWSDHLGKFRGYIGIITDITKIRQTEETLRGQQKWLREAIRARDELVSICGHEFKTPLSALRLQTQTAMKRISMGDQSVYEPAKVQKLIQMYGSQIERLVHLVDDMLDVTRINSGKFHLKLERLNLSQLTLEVIERFKDQFESSGSIVHLFVPPNIFLTGDPFRIEQVLINLITNAMKYGKGEPISVRLVCEKAAILLSVQDQGVGISIENHKRIFERFERAISATEVSGLGLGLYIVKAIVEAHQGTIDVQSKLGQGAKFTLKLPLFQNDHE